MTQQLTLEAHARASDPDTSHAAADAARPLRPAQLAVLACMRIIGPSPDDVIAHRYGQARHHHGWPMQSPSGLRTRRAELVAAGLVFDTGLRSRLATGRYGIVWAARGAAS